jgi:hypothetical protein
VSIVLPPFNLLIVLTQDYSCLKFDLTLGVIPSVFSASSCSIYFSRFYCI